MALVKYVMGKLLLCYFKKKRNFFSLQCTSYLIKVNVQNECSKIKLFTFFSGTYLPPFLHQHTNGQKPFWHTLNQTCGLVSPKLPLLTWCWKGSRRLVVL